MGAGFAALYGGAVSLLNTLLINRHTNTQKANANISAQAGLKMLFISVIMRMTMVIGLILMGYFVLKLNSAALIIGLILGLISFLMDKVLQK
ncbi:MAG: hypothetical protein FXV79_04450 [Candidatus Thioglobus sp.]|nr:MAG: hypothetical protein FXV79_04450 [Candidatus Thioglobus sp.]